VFPPVVGGVVEVVVAGALVAGVVAAGAVDVAGAVVAAVEGGGPPAVGDPDTWNSHRL
jgi:hypothetical protein